MPPNNLTTSFTIKIEGTELGPEVLAKIREWRVEDHLKLPDTFSITFYEPDPAKMTVIDDAKMFKVGSAVTIGVTPVPVTGARPGTAASAETLIDGLITAIEPEFSAEAGAIMVVRGYDRSHKMNQQKKATTFQDMTVSQIVSKVAQGGGLQADVGAFSRQAKFTQQNNETDWEFLGRMAERVGAKMTVTAGKLQFKPVGGAAAGPPVVELEWGHDLLSFRPRVTGVQQASEVVVRAWDPKTKRAIEATAQPPGRLMAQIGQDRGTLVSALGHGKHTVADRPVADQQEATELAKSVMEKIANSFVEAEGVCLGNPKVKAGEKVKISGIGTRFGGTYTLSASRHVYKANGYRTYFTISGQAERSLVDLLTPARTKRWGNSVVLGVVTNNDDPEKRGRVRVKYPALADTEGNWARVCQVSAGPDHGLTWIPAVNDEVVIGFEHDDVNYPYVLGAVYNGQSSPLAQAIAKQALDLVKGGDDQALAKEGSYSLKSAKHVAIEAKEKMGVWVGEELQIKVGECTVTCKKDGTVEIKGKNVTLEATQNLTLKATQNIDITATQQLNASAKQGATVDGGATTTVKASGMVSVSGSQVSLG